MNLHIGTEAMVVNTVRRGPRQMAGMGDSFLLDLANGLTGGQISQTQAQLDRLEVLLKVSIGASIVAGLAGFAVLFSGKR
jgi:hypothetical protein